MAASQSSYYERRNELAKERGYRNYYDERKARATYKGAAGSDAPRGITKKQMLRASVRLDIKAPEFKKIFGFEPNDHLAWTQLLSG